MVKVYPYPKENPYMTPTRQTIYFLRIKAKSRDLDKDILSELEKEEP